MSFVRATVTGVSDLSGRLRRIVLDVADLSALALPDVADAAVGIYFPPAGQHATPEPPDGEGRNYSVRFADGTRLTIDVVLHASGPGTDWARGVRPGDTVLLDHARSWYRPEPTTDWQLLVADLAGLPALARIIAESDSSTSLLAIVEVLDAAELDYLPTRPHVTVVSSVGTGNGGPDGKLAELVTRQPLPAGRGYCWFAGEAAQSRLVRKHFRSHGWSADQFDIVGYWRLDSEAWDRRFEPIADELVAVYTAALAAGKSEKAASEEFDEALEQAGL